MSSARRDPKLIALRLRDGREGLCRWWEIVEIIAEEMNDSERCEIRINGAFLSRELGFRSSIDGRSFVDRLAIDGLLIADTSSIDWLLKCPKLLELRDHRIKNRVHKSAPEQNRTEVDKNILHKPVSTIVNKPVDNPSPKAQRISLSENGRQWIGITPEKMAVWKEAYPALDIVRELASMIAWLNANPKNKKSNYERFMVNWFKRNQDSAPVKRLNGSGSTIDESDGEWDKIIEHIRRKGTSVKIEGISDRGRAALNKIGGMSVLGMARSDQMSFIKKDFKNAFLTT